MIIARDSFLSKYVGLIDIIYLLLWFPSTQKIPRS
ncbi:Uncharacterised protein [uncultured Eubacterium sp.]|jgi:hypothetical protein|nr:Uncharacterised protein [uncultured Eubacterium sp.]